MMDDDRLLNLKEAAKMLGVSVTTVYKLIDRGQIPYNRSICRLRIWKSWIEDYIKSEMERSHK